VGFFLRHFEKLILGLCLLAVSFACWQVLSGLQKARATVAQLGAQNVELTEKIPPKKLDHLDLDELIAAENLEWRQEPGANGGSLFSPRNYVRCINPACTYLLPYAYKLCPYCAAEQGDLAESESAEPVENDADRDGIPDEIEDKYDFLDSKVAGDAARDYDEDKFSNLEEYRAKTGMDDPLSHPPLATKLRLFPRRGIYTPPFPISFTKLSRYQTDDKNKWDAFFMVQEPNSRRLKSRILKVGEMVLDYKIVQFDYKEKKLYNAELMKDEIVDASEVVLQKKGEAPIVLVRGKNAPATGTILRLLYLSDDYNPRKCRRLVVVSDKGFELTDEAGQTEPYMVATVDETSELVMVKRRDLPEAEAKEITIRKLDLKKDFLPPPDAGSAKGGAAAP
jgi:hypothetical protein